MKPQLHHVVACTCCSVGTLLALIGAIMFWTAAPRELPVWYHVPMCPMNLSDAGIPTTDAFVTRDLSLSSSAALASVCPVGVVPGQVPIQVDVGLFERDVPYIAFTARTDGTQLFNSDGGTPEAKGAYLNMDMGSYFSLRSANERTRRLGPRLGAPLDSSGGPQRRLLKGGSRSSYSYSSGRTYRSSYSYNTWGNAIVTRRALSRTGVAAIAASTVVTVVAASAILGVRGGSGYTATYSQSCRSASGCSYTLPKSFTKDEWDSTRFTIPSGAPATTLTLFVEAQLIYPSTLTAGAASQYPNLFVGFVSPEDPDDSSSDGLIVVGVLLAFLGTFVAMKVPRKVYKPCQRSYDNCGNNRAGYTAVSPADTAIRGSAGAAAPSIVPMPLPPVPTVTSHLKYTVRNGDHRSMAEIQGAYTVVDVTSNDIAVLGSLHSLPAIQLLDVTDNNVSTLAQLASQSLISLTVDNNDLRGLYGVLGAPNLQWVSAVNNDIGSIGVGGVMPHVRYLNLASNQITTCNNVEHFASVTHLDLSNNDITLVSGLERLESLQCVNLAQNNISDPTYLLAMAFLPHLKWVNIQGNDMTAVQVQDVRDAFAERPDVQLLS